MNFFNIHILSILIQSIILKFYQIGDFLCEIFLYLV